MTEPRNFVARGERGPHGDHGQDGRQGPKGEPGIPGAVGRTGRRGPTILGTDRRLIFILAYTTACMVFVFTVLGIRLSDERAKERRFERQIVANCVALNEAHAKYNALLDQLITNAQNTSALTPEQKQQAIAKYGPLHLVILPCPPRP